MMLQAVLPWVTGAFALALLLCAVRAALGPTLPDRILALDAMTVNALALLTVQGITSGTRLHVELMLLIALLGFITTVALAQFVGRRGGTP